MNLIVFDGSSELSSLMGAVRGAVRYKNYIYRDARVVELSYLYHLLSVSGQLLIVMVIASIGSEILKLLDRKILIFSKSGTNSRVHLCDIKVFNCITVMCSYILAHHIGLPTQC